MDGSLLVLNRSKGSQRFCHDDIFFDRSEVLTRCCTMMLISRKARFSHLSPPRFPRGTCRFRGVARLLPPSISERRQDMLGFSGRSTAYPTHVHGVNPIQLKRTRCSSCFHRSVNVKFSTTHRAVAEETILLRIKIASPQ